MHIADVHALASDPASSCDVAVIGSGPAGLTIARELAGTGLRVVLLESGGTLPDPEADALNEIISVGEPRVMTQTKVRNRVLGGTSATWSGRAVVIDGLDLDERSWVPHSGWPLARAELEPYFARAMDHLGAPVADNTDPSFVGRVTAAVPPLVTEGLVRYAWALSRDSADPRDSMRFGPRAQREPMPGVTCYVHATVTQLLVDGSTVTGVEVTAPDRSIFMLTARATVVAGGAIENARLLLASDRVVAGGIGNDHDQVGRFLMDHLRGPVGVFGRSANTPMQERFGDRLLADGARATPGYALSPAVQAGESLLNCALWIFPVTDERDPFTRIAAARGSVRGRARAVRAAISHPLLLLKGAATIRRHVRTPTRLLDRLELHAIVEQRPDPDSRLTLDPVRRDALGVPLSRIDWRISEQEERTVRRATALVVDELAAQGLPVPLLTRGASDPSVRLGLPDVAHPIGTTRMSADPRDGVVDPDCAVHGWSGVYLAGSSVFPTSAHANPTQTLVALAVRLADHLKVVLAG